MNCQPCCPNGASVSNLAAVRYLRGFRPWPAPVESPSINSSARAIVLPVSSLCGPSQASNLAACSALLVELLALFYLVLFYVIFFCRFSSAHGCFFWLLVLVVVSSAISVPVPTAVAACGPDSPAAVPE